MINQNLDRLTTLILMSIGYALVFYAAGLHIGAAILGTHLILAGSRG